jgi:hypothetical protein
LGKKIVLVGTNHLIQAKDYNGTTEFKDVLSELLAKHSTQVILEEWHWLKTSRPTVGHA